MVNAFSKIVDQLSSYQIFNYLFPGIIFIQCAEHLNIVHFPDGDILFRLFEYYLAGMILSRNGSVVIAPIYKKIRFVVYAKYSNYLEAAKQDSKIDILVMENNTFRTLISVFIILLIAYMLDSIVLIHNFVCSKLFVITCLLLLIILFSLSYRKQTSFIRKRTHNILALDDEKELESLKNEQKKKNILKSIFN